MQASHISIFFALPICIIQTIVFTLCLMKTNTRNVCYAAILFSLASTAVMPVVAQDIYLQTDFQEGIPADYTLLDRDENPTMAGLRNISFPGGSWAVSLVDSNDDRAAVSSSFSTYDYPVEDWLITPRVHIASDAAALRWQARSVHHDFRDGYAVMISTGGTAPSDFVELFRVEEEDYHERVRALSLSAYAGKDVYVAFVHNSTQRFMLAIDDITIGELAPAYTVDNLTPVSAAGGGMVTVEGDICNVGSAHEFSAVCRADGILYEPEVAPALCGTGESLPFRFEVPAPAEGKVAYRVGIPQEKDTAWVVTDTIYCSAFARRMLVEEYTARWCTSCPGGIMMMHDFEKRFRDGIIPVVAHSSYNDPMGDADYSAGMSYWLFNMPSFIYDRVSSLKSQEARADGNIYRAFARPVEAEIDLDRVAMTADGRLKAEAVVRFAGEFDNSGDRYRVAFIVTENTLCVDSANYNQSNNCTMPVDAEFYFLPVNIPAKHMQYNHVARGLSDAFTGVPELLPAETLLPGEDYQVEYTFEIPASIRDRKNISVTAVVIDSCSREVFNACRAESIDYTGSGDIARGDGCMPHRIISDVSGVTVFLAADGMAEARLYSLDGSLVAQARGTGQLHLSTAGMRGAFVIAISNDNRTTYKKLLINIPL